MRWSPTGDLEMQMDRTTKMPPKKASRLATPELLSILRGIHGLGSMVERAGGPNHAFTSRVLSRQKPPSQRWLAAVNAVIKKIDARTTLEALNLFKIDAGFAEGQHGGPPPGEP